MRALVFYAWHLFTARCVLRFHKTPLPCSPPPKPLCFPLSLRLSLEVLEDHTQSQEKIMMIVLLPVPLCLCPHSSKMKGGNNYLSVSCLKSFDIYLEEQVWFPLAIGTVLSFTVHIKWLTN